MIKVLYKFGIIIIIIILGLSLEFHVRSISPIPLEGFSLNFGHMFASLRRCAELISTMPTQGQGHSTRSQV